MSKINNKTIDYLFEDPVIPSQKFALVSIVGPHMPQKCSVWGLKIRGVADTLSAAKTLSQRILRVDNDYDIYTVEVGKFFPLQVDPMEVSDIEYQNEQLNTLMKSYLENKQNANDHWNQRKNELIKEAIREGKNQEELANKPEHPIAVLQRIKNYESTLEEMKENLKNLTDDLEKSKTKFASYTDEERELAQKEINSAINAVAEEVKESESVDEIRQKMLSEFDLNAQSSISNDESLVSAIEKMRQLENEIEELNNFKQTVSEASAPKAYKRILQNIEDAEKELMILKNELNSHNNSKLVNSYINENYPNPQYQF